MELYIVMMDGNDEPVAVFNSQDKADGYVTDRNETSMFEYYVLGAYKLNEV